MFNAGQFQMAARFPCATMRTLTSILHSCSSLMFHSLATSLMCLCIQRRWIWHFHFISLNVAWWALSVNCCMLGKASLTWRSLKLSLPSLTPFYSIADPCQNVSRLVKSNKLCQMFFPSKLNSLRSRSKTGFQCTPLPIRHSVNDISLTFLVWYLSEHYSIL